MGYWDAKRCNLWKSEKRKMLWWLTVKQSTLCYPTPNREISLCTKERKSPATTPASGGSPNSGNVHDESLLIQLPVPKKRPGKVKYQYWLVKYRGWWDLSGQETEKMSNITTHVPLQKHLHDILGRHSLIDRLILACREVYPSEGDLPEHMGPRKSIKEIQQIFRELGMRQPISVTVFEGLD